MSYVPKLEVHLDEESYTRLLAAAQAAQLSADALLAELVQIYLAEDGVADEVLRRESDPQPSISIEEMRRRLAS